MNNYKIFFETAGLYRQACGCAIMELQCMKEEGNKDKMGKRGDESKPLVIDLFGATVRKKHTTVFSFPPWASFAHVELANFHNQYVCYHRTGEIA